MVDVAIRPATAADDDTIKRMIRDARLDPTSLKWRNFLVAECDGAIVSIGQIKPYPGCEELGSLVTLREYRGQGIASKLMGALEERAGRPIYLLCAAHMEPFYKAHGYHTITWWQAPAFLKLKLAPTILFIPFGVRVLVMRKV